MAQGSHALSLPSFSFFCDDTLFLTTCLLKELFLRLENTSQPWGFHICFRFCLEIPAPGNWSTFPLTQLIPVCPHPAP